LRILLILLCACLAGSVFAQPEIDVLRGGVSIPDGGSDDVSNTGFSPFNLTYTIANTGSSNLALTSMPEVVISNESNCSVSMLAAPSTPVASAGSTTFTLQVSPTSATGFSFDISIPNDDTDENPYDFTFNGNTTSSNSSSGGGGSNGGCSSNEAPGPELLCWLVLLSSALLGRTVFHKPPTQRDLRRVDD
jgi:hypothetical protein